MGEFLGVGLLVLCSLLGLVLVPFGLPGLWVMVLGLLGYGWLTGFRSVGVATITLVVGIAFLGEILEWWVGFRFAQRYGASPRAGWGALIGGMVGAVVGMPVPVVGSILGALVGAFVGAVAFEYLSSRRPGTALGAGWGAVVGRAAAAGIKIGLGFVVIVIGIAAVIGA